jgi:hypothetical protein
MPEAIGNGRRPANRVAAAVARRLATLLPGQLAMTAL